jgi:hypothetical protein
MRVEGSRGTGRKVSKASMFVHLKRRGLFLYDQGVRFCNPRRLRDLETLKLFSLP